MSSCQHGYSNCKCNVEVVELSNGAGPIIRDIIEQIERPLDAHETWEVNKMIRAGFATRQIISKVKEIEAYRIANIRRERYVKKIKELGTTLTGSEMVKFKHAVDVEDGVHKEWETIGYPAYYRSGLLEEIERNKQKAKRTPKKKTTKKQAPKKKVEPIICENESEEEDRRMRDYIFNCDATVD